MDRLPLEVVNYLCTFLPAKDIKATFSAKTIKASGVKLDLVKRKYKKNNEKIKKLKLQTNMISSTLDKWMDEWNLHYGIVDQLSIQEKENLLRMSEKLIVRMKIISSCKGVLLKNQNKYLRKNIRIVKWLRRKRLFINLKKM